MNEQTWRRITGWAGVLVGILAFLLVVERLDWLIVPALSVLPPFIIAFLIAFLLNPQIKRLQGRGFSRNWAVLLVSLFFLSAFAGFSFYLVPKIVEQGVTLAQNVPEYARSVGQQLNELFARERPLLEKFNLPTSVSEALNRFSNQIRSVTTSALSTLSSWVFALVGTVLWLFIVPIITIYLLNSWEHIGRKFIYLIPDDHRPRVIPLFEAIGNVFNSYIRGQLILSLLYGGITTIVLLLFGVNYSLILGLIAGLVSPIPFIGSTIILLSTTIVAYATNPNWWYVGGVAVAMLVQNNFLFDNILGPRILGGSVGLNLAWSVFALMLGGSMFGIIGMLLAVPVGAVIQVILCSFFPKLCQIPPTAQGTSHTDKPSKSSRGSRKRKRSSGK